jgi:hypothetical protein
MKPSRPNPLTKNLHERKASKSHQAQHLHVTQFCHKMNMTNFVTKSTNKLAKERVVMVVVVVFLYTLPS